MTTATRSPRTARSPRWSWSATTAGPANESGQSLTVTGVTQGANGTVTFTAGDVTYTPNANYFGTDCFTYTVCDNGTTNAVAAVLCDTATVTITVTPVNDDPVANDDTATVAEDGSATPIDVLANDNDGPDAGRP